MRIIAKERDVYDLQHALFDADRVWVREEETFQIRQNKGTSHLTKIINLSTKGELYSSRERLIITPVLVGSELHWLFKIHYTFDKQWENFQTFDPARLTQMLEERNMEMHTGLVGGALKNVSQLMEQLKELESQAYSTLQSLNRPLAWIRKTIKSETDDTIYFEVLTNFSFHSHGLPWMEIDSNLYRLHQSLESYIWGVIGTGEKQVVETSDLDRLKAHGFDEKLSFRNRGK